MPQGVPPIPMAPITWTLQFALASGFAIATVSVSLALRRGAIRVLAVAFALAAAAFLQIWLAVIGGLADTPTRATTLLLSASFLCAPLVPYVLFVHLTDVIAGRATSAMPSRNRLVWGIGAAVAMTAVSIVVTSAETFTGVAAMALASSIVTSAVFSDAARRAFAARNGAPTGARALAMLGVGFALIAARSVVNLGVTATAVRSGAAPEYTFLLMLLQAALVTVGCALVLAAALDFERAAAVAQAERLRVAEASLLHSQRFESLGRLSAAVAHDVNNVLMAISVALGNVRQHAAAANHSADEIAEIERATRLGADLTRQLLAFARPGARTSDRFDVGERLRGLEGLVRRLVGRQVTATFSLGAAQIAVEMEPTHFDQVILNLVTNARDAMPSGGTVTIALAVGSLDGGDGPVLAARIRVTDTGPGMSPDVVPRIFEPFYSTKSTGTGLGLATAASIVRDVGGRIEVVSAPGQGTQFDVYLPVAVAAD